MVGRCCLVVFALAFVPLEAPGQETTNTIKLGVVELRLGMEESVAMNTLREVYLVEKRPRGSDWVVLRRDRAEVMGSVVFSETGHLIVATKFRTQEIAGTAVDLARALHSAIWESTRNGEEESCVVGTEQVYSPLEIKAAYIRCGKRIIAITLFRTNTETVATGEQQEMWFARVEETIYSPSAENLGNTLRPR